MPENTPTPSQYHEGRHGVYSGALMMLARLPLEVQRLCCATRVQKTICALDMQPEARAA